MNDKKNEQSTIIKCKKFVSILIFDLCISSWGGL